MNNKVTNYYPLLSSNNSSFDARNQWKKSLEESKSSDGETRKLTGEFLIMQIFDEPEIQF